MPSAELRIVLCEVGGDHRRTLAREQPRLGRALSPGRSGDDDDLALDAAHPTANPTVPTAAGFRRARRDHAVKLTIA